MTTSMMGPSFLDRDAMPLFSLCLHFFDLTNGIYGILRWEEALSIKNAKTFWHIAPSWRNNTMFFGNQNSEAPRITSFGAEIS